MTEFREKNWIIALFSQNFVILNILKVYSKFLFICRLNFMCWCYKIETVIKLFPSSRKLFHDFLNIMCWNIPRHYHYIFSFLLLQVSFISLFVILIFLYIFPLTNDLFLLRIYRFSISLTTLLSGKNGVIWP